MGDGAYDSVKLINAILNKQPDASIVIPPPSADLIRMGTLVYGERAQMPWDGLRLGAQ